MQTTYVVIDVMATCLLEMKSYQGEEETEGAMLKVNAFIKGIILNVGKRLSLHSHTRILVAQVMGKLHVHGAVYVTN